MALPALLRTGIGVGKKLLGRKKKTKWAAESDMPIRTRGGKGPYRKLRKWQGESGLEGLAPKKKKVSRGAKRKAKTRKKKLEVASRYGHDPAKIRRRRAAAGGVGAAAGVGAGIGLSKKKSITGAGMDVPKTKGMSSYKVKSGDTLSEIASKTGTTIKQLKKANPNITNINKIKVGQTIKIPSKKIGRKSVYQGLKRSEMNPTTKKKIKPSISRLKSGGLVGMGAALRGGGAVRSR